MGRVSAFAAYRANARPGISLPEVEGTTRPTDLRTVGSGNAERCSITLRGFPPEVARSGRRSLRRSARKRSCRAEIRCGVGASGSSAICERRVATTLLSLHRTSCAVALVPEGATVVTVVVTTVVISQLRLPRAKPTPVKIAMCLKRYRSKHCAQADSNRQRMDSKSYFSALVASSCDGIRKNCKSARCATRSFTQSSQPTADCPTVRSVSGRTTADVNLPAVFR